MAEETFDFIVLGGGHNGLTCAGLLAKAGWSVCVLERRHNIGGGCATEEVTLPGFKHNIHSQGHVSITSGPVYKALDLDKYGVEYVYPDPTWATVFKDGSALVLHRDVDETCESIAEISKKDAKTYKEFYQRFEHLRHLYVASWYSPPLPPSKVFSIFEGTTDGQLLLQMWNASCQDICDSFFESEKVKVFILIIAMQGGNLLDLYGVGAYIPILFSGMHTKPWGVCVGGSRMLAEGLQKSVEAAGGVVRKNAHVSKINVENGKATGVTMEDGSFIRAKHAIGSNTNVKATFLDYVGEEHCDEEFLRMVRAYLPDEPSPFTPHFALNDPPQYTASEKHPDVQKAMFVGWGCENTYEMQIHANDIRVGIPSKIVPGCSISTTVHDPSEAPPGKHTAFVWQYAPFNIADGGAERWATYKEEYADYVQQVWCEYAPNMQGDNVLARYVYSPLDISRTTISMFEGSMNHGHVSPNQMGIFRPFPGWAHYRMPIEGLYLVGSSTHPTGGITGAPGFNAAGVIADDFKLKKWWWRPSRSLRS